MRLLFTRFITAPLFRPQSVDGYTDHFCLLAVMLQHRYWVRSAAVHVSVQVPVFNSFGYIPRSGVADACGNLFNFLKNCQTLFHSGCTILHFTPAIPKGSNFSTVFQRCFFFLFLSFLSLITATLVGEERYLSVVLICISLMVE